MYRDMKFRHSVVELEKIHKVSKEFIFKKKSVTYIGRTNPCIQRIHKIIQNVICAFK